MTICVNIILRFDLEFYYFCNVKIDNRSLFVIVLIGAYNFPCLLKFPRTKAQQVVKLYRSRVYVGFTFCCARSWKTSKDEKLSPRFFFVNIHSRGARRARE